MYTLSMLLSRRSWRELQATAAAHGMRFNIRHGKAHGMSELYHDLVANGTLRKRFNALHESDYDPLLSLGAQDGTMPCWEFTAEYGEIRPYRPWDAAAPRQPWKQPISVAEKLWYLAFIGIIPGENGHPDRVCAPVEVLALLPPLPVPEPVVRDTPPTMATPDALLVDVAVLLGMLLYEDILPGWERC